MPPKFEILRFVDHSHPASADRLKDPIMRDCSALQQWCGGLIFIRRDGLGHDGHGWCIQDTLRRGSMPDEGFNFIEQTLIFSTRFLQKGIALAIREIRSGVVQFLNYLPPLRLHGDPSWLSSRSSHALASFQSRITVSGDTCRATAVSSTVSPPKKRSSTTSLLRASTTVSCFSASSTAKSSDPTTPETVAASSNSICGKWPPLF